MTSILFFSLIEKKGIKAALPRKRFIKWAVNISVNCSNNIIYKGRIVAGWTQRRFETRPQTAPLTAGQATI